LTYAQRPDADAALELKYLIPEATALLVRDFVRSYLAMDEFSVGRPNYSYPVHSLYLDSDDLKLYWRTINGDKNRFKLRLRYYSAQPGTPVFFEIKRRMNNCILKQTWRRAAGRSELVLRASCPRRRTWFPRTRISWWPCSGFQGCGRSARTTCGAYFLHARGLR